EGDSADEASKNHSCCDITVLKKNERFCDYRNGHCAATHQMLSMQTTLSCKLRYKRLAASETALAGENVPYVPEEWASALTAWQIAIVTQGNVLGITCEPRDAHSAPINKIVGVWKLAEHNHVVSIEVFDLYPSNRKIKHADSIAKVEAIMEGHSKRTKIIDYLLGRGEKLTKRNVDNLIQVARARARAREEEVDDDFMVTVLIKKFLDKDPDNVATVDNTDVGHTGVISMTTAKQALSHTVSDSATTSQIQAVDLIAADVATHPTPTEKARSIMLENTDADRTQVTPKILSQLSTGALPSDADFEPVPFTYGLGWEENREEKYKQGEGVKEVELVKANHCRCRGLNECCERVGGPPVRFTKVANRMPKLVTKANPVGNADVFNLLPEGLLKACVVKLPVSETSADNPGTPGSDSDGEVHCLSIASVGTFPEAQLKAMMMLSTFEKRCKEGRDAMRWLREVVAYAVNVDKHEEVNRVAEWIDACIACDHQHG
ncbi:TPA: LOW QUALITY PROTEIN: hypothetical protein N0F65_009331, partial [Lagenidium giganteum]